MCRLQGFGQRQEKRARNLRPVNGRGVDALAVFLTLIFPFTRILMTWNVP